MILRRFILAQNETLDIDPIDVTLAGLPPALEGFCIAVIADLHLQTLTDYHRRILSAVRGSQPECIAILGDSIDSNTPLVDALTPFFAALSEVAPVVAILGNNDCLPGRIHTLRAMYRDAGVTLLENETRLLPARGLPLRITGLIDPAAERRGIEPDRPEEMPQSFVPLAQVAPPRPAAAEKVGELLPSLLLLHQPQLAAQYAGLAPSLVLAGHAHGGQFRLPGIGGLYAPDQGLFPRLTSGLYAIDGTKLVVSRGLGNHAFPLRLNNPPHLPILHLKRA